MVRFTFKKGLTFIEINTRWQMMRRLITGRLQFESDSGEIKNLTDKEILYLWNSGKWRVDEETLGFGGDGIYLVTPADLATFPIKWQEIATRKLKYINEINPELNKYHPEKWKEVINRVAKEMNDPKPPCSASVHGWWKKYRITKSINSLLPRVRTGFVKKEDPRYKVFEDVVNTTYLNAQKLPVLELVQKVNNKITILNIGRQLEVLALA